MELSEVTKTLLDAKKAKGLSFADLESSIGRDAVWLATLFYRQASASEEEAQKLVNALGLGPEVAQALTEILARVSRSGVKSNSSWPLGSARRPSSTTHVMPRPFRDISSTTSRISSMPPSSR